VSQKELAEACRDRFVNSGDIDSVRLGHHAEHRLELLVAQRRELFLNLANHPSLSAIEQFELATVIGNRSDLFDEIACLVRGTAAQAAQIARQLASPTALIVSDFL
jgi:hypothetical protein